MINKNLQYRELFSGMGLAYSFMHDGGSRKGYQQCTFLKKKKKFLIINSIQEHIYLSISSGGGLRKG